MSLTLDQLIEEQLRTAGHLDRSVANLLKLGKNPSIALLVRRRDLVKEYWATFQNRHNEIMRMSGASTSTYVTGDQYSVSEFTYSERLAEIDETIAQLTGVPVYTPSPQPTVSTGATNPTVVTQRKALELPDINIPKFDGNPLQLESFRDRVKSSQRLVRFQGCADLAPISCLKMDPYVSNRVSDIQGTIPSKLWSYVGTKENPDLATRGITPSQLQQSDLWWRGPSWISISPEKSELPFCSDVLIPGQKSTLLSIQTCQENDLLVRYSSLDQLLCITSRCLRFKNLTLRENHGADFPPTTPYLTCKELNQALVTWVKYSQSVFFAEEINKLQAHLRLATASSILALRPFLDDEGILRLGRRLQKSELSYAEKHPILLNKRCFLSVLLIRDAHLRTFHGAASLTRSYLERRFWIVHGSSLIKSAVRGCVKCTRYAGRTSGQVMGNLPLKRITPNLSFIAAGVDYAGPILIETARGRGQKTFKGYICVFICLVTKAIALEAVCGLTSQAFIAAFRRFNSRRGPCQSLISDNGTTFKGADRQLKQMFKAVSAFYTDTASLLVKDGVDWNYILPYTPHMGGLWEAGVKSVKHHTVRERISGCYLSAVTVTEYVVMSASKTTRLSLPNGSLQLRRDSKIASSNSD